jgi:hypothetical protein
MVLAEPVPVVRDGAVGSVGFGPNPRREWTCMAVGSVFVALPRAHGGKHFCASTNRQLESLVRAASVELWAARWWLIVCCLAAGGMLMTHDEAQNT